MQDVVLAGGAEADVDQSEVGEDGDAEEKKRREASGGVLGEQQHFAPDRREQIEMQAALDHFPANEAGEDAKAAEEDAEADVVELDDAGQHVRVVIEIKRRVRSTRRWMRMMPVGINARK